MTFCAPATIPNIHYGYTAPTGHFPAHSHSHRYPFESLPKPHPSTCLYDRVYNDDHNAAKVHLRALLKKNALSGAPVGFPFHCVRDAYGRPALSHTSYEFKEYFCFSDHRGRTQCATFVYSAPDRHARMTGPPTEARMMKWRIYLPARESVTSRDAPKRVSIAHVQVDALVMETSFGLDLMTTPQILLEALALSVELGVLITVQVAQQKTALMYPSKRDVYYESGEIIFLSTDARGKTEVALVFEP
ncbi:hypothetical protein CVT26_000046 [Gymnopilus dilepis]|uniref:Uncharacterized protein n=1 Tax=Gymnopilus dilepis TaxID=231916 RepID=A0A409VGG4_9AGAR|nr:hypothetical protein CVT26_000046 [Gymnopilus dilepis]